MVGNAFGFAAWRMAGVVIPWLWAGRTENTSILLLVPLIALTFMLLAAPPVLAGALGAWLAHRAQLWVGLASGLWSLLLVQTMPAALPLAASLWYAPTVLVLLSGAVGGYMLAAREEQ